MFRLSQRKLSPFASSLLVLLAGCQGAAGGGDKPSASPQSPSAQPTSSISPSPSGTATTPGSSGTQTSTKPSTPASAAELGRVTAVRLADAKSGWTGGEGWIARTDDGGKNWQSQYQGAGTVHQLFALNGQDAWATTEDAGTATTHKYPLLGTTDGGKHWTKTGEAPNGGFLHFVSKMEAYSANAKTVDGGKTWSTLKVPDHLVGDAYFHDKNNGWAVTQQKDSAQVAHTTDGGNTWKTVMTRTTVSPLTGALIRSAGTNDAWVEWIGDSGMTQTSYSLFHTSDGGKAWQTVLANSTAGGGPAPGFPIDYNQGPKNTGTKPGPLYVVDTKTAFMGGDCPSCDKPNSVGKTVDGGKTWINGTQTVEGFGPAYLAMADANQGWWITTDNAAPSVMYTTSDGGSHWTKVHTFEKPKSAS